MTLLASVADPQFVADFLASRGRSCVDCGFVITRHSTGRCRSCSAKRLNQNAAIVERRNAKPRGGYNRKPLPADFTAIAGAETNVALTRRYDVSDSVIQRWRAETGIAAPRLPRGAAVKREVPADLAERAAAMTNAEMASVYGCCTKTVRTWLKGAGLPVRRNAEPFRTPATVNRGRCDPLVARQRSAAVQQNTRNTRVPPPHLGSEAERAADFLRRFAPTYRCDAAGRMVEDGFFWRYGNAFPLGDDELLERAGRKGWWA